MRERERECVIKRERLCVNSMRERECVIKRERLCVNNMRERVYENESKVVC